MATAATVAAVSSGLAILIARSELASSEPSAVGSALFLWLVVRSLHEELEHLLDHFLRVASLVESFSDVRVGISFLSILGERTSLDELVEGLGGLLLDFADDSAFGGLPGGLLFRGSAGSPTSLGALVTISLGSTDVEGKFVVALDASPGEGDAQVFVVIDSDPLRAVVVA